MTSCPNAAPAPLRCPTQEELAAQALALLPRGRAWQSNDGGPEPFYDPTFQADFVQDDAFQTKGRKGSILFRFWSAVAQAFHYLHERACALRFEFWCATQSETLDLWMREYGLPDPCDPFPDLCTKVAAIGGTRCDYYAMIAARAGWRIECLDVSRSCNAARAGCVRTGCGARVGRSFPAKAEFIVRVLLNESPSYVAAVRRRPLAGRMRAGQRMTCPAPILITPLKCLLDRVVHAHNQIVYETA